MPSPAGRGYNRRLDNFRVHTVRSLLVCLLLAAATLAGCGQKGPLFLPPETPPPQAGTP